MKLTSTGSEDIYLGAASQLRTNLTVFQVDTPLLWSGSLIPMRAVDGAGLKLPSVFTRLQDGAILSGSILGSGSLNSITTGSYMCENLGGDIYLRHLWNSGSVDIYTVILPE